MTALLCDPTHLYIVIGVLLLAMVLLGSGKGVGVLLRPLLNKLTGRGAEDGSERQHLTRGDVAAVVTAAITTAFMGMDRPNCTSHALIKERQDGVLMQIAFVIEECKSIWLELKEMNKRQIILREKLPEQYVAKTELTIIQDRLRSIDGKLDRYMELAVKR